MIVKCVFYFFKVFGLATTNLKLRETNDPESWDWSFNSSVGSILYNFIIICALILLNYHTIGYMKAVNYRVKNRSEEIIYFWSDISSISCTIFILLIYCNKQKKLMLIASKISEAREISKIIDKQNYNKKSKVFKSIVGIICFKIISIIIAYFVLFIIFVDYDVNVILYTFSLILCMLIINLTLMQYGMIIEFVKIYLKLTKKLFGKILKDHESYFDFRPFNKINFNFKLDQVIKLYRLITEITEEVSKFYSVTMLWSLFNIFATLIIVLYEFIEYFITSQNFTLSQESSINFILFIINIIPVSSLTILVSLTILEVS